jgi:acetyl esterase/lipase
MQSSHAGRKRVQVEDRDVNWCSRALRLRIVRPDHVEARAPVIMYFHGADWVMGIWRPTIAW